MDADFFPDIIQSLPMASIPLPGLESRLLQANDKQVVFMEFAEGVDVPEHSHAAQWCVVLDGKIELTIDGVVQTFQRGDTYYIRSGQKHSARIFAGYKDLNLFDQADRYAVKRGP